MLYSAVSVQCMRQGCVIFRNVPVPIYYLLAMSCWSVFPFASCRGKFLLRSTPRAFSRPEENSTLVQVLKRNYYFNLLYYKIM